jgi:hypothetical protein
MAENYISKGAGIIPDFFHDIIAYIIPGYTAIIIFIINMYIMKIIDITIINKIDLGSFSLLSIIAYVIGRFFEQLGIIIYKKKKCKKKSPKWYLVFGIKQKYYTEAFRKNLEDKITEWLKKNNGPELMQECKEKYKDDYFNLIQFYCREKFPAVALYEKKQNATIILTRSLALMFWLNFLCYFFMFGIIHHVSPCGIINLPFDPTSVIWIIVTSIFGFVFYDRYILDSRYHAMYIFESFIGLVKQKEEPEPNA